MKRVVVVLLLGVTACSAGAPETGVFLSGTFDAEEYVSFEAADEELRYLLWFPPGYDRAEPHPLIVFLHGSGDADYDEQWVQSYGLPEVLVFDDPPEGFDFVVLAPQAGARTAWWSGRQMEAVGGLVDEIVSTYAIDPARVYVTGISMGGYGSWHLATERPDLFAGVVSISGSGYGSADLPPDVDVCALAPVPIRAIHGGIDPISLPEANLSVIAQYERRCGVTVDVEIYPDQGHFGAYRQAYRDPALYRWMLDQG